MTQSNDPKLPSDEALTAETDLWSVIHRNMTEVGDLSRPRAVRPAETGPGVLPGPPKQPMTPALQRTLAQRAVAERRARRHK
jgi:hypothetical protein